ncbi:hypothetical protein HMPREF3226_01565 [Prevotella corporis]|uniref:Uncharacterized protein n=1 Tax=Prevotella corporis TaxID=28128 RepID=A0A133Q6W2_9BACT|nr:hypothetical protein HMPREF3226_01565 [Prevotella corporis]
MILQEFDNVIPAFEEPFQPCPLALMPSQKSVFYTLVICP